MKKIMYFHVSSLGTNVRNVFFSRRPRLHISYEPTRKKENEMYLQCGVRSAEWSVISSCRLSCAPAACCSVLWLSVWSRAAGGLGPPAPPSNTSLLLFVATSVTEVITRFIMRGLHGRPRVDSREPVAMQITSSR